MSRILQYTLIVLAMAACAYSQAVTGTIFGTASDRSGGRMPGAAVRAINTDTSESHSMVTDAQGAYLFPALLAGRYRVETEASGFKKVVRDSVGLGVNQNARVDLALEVGSVNQEVHVRDDAPLAATREAQVATTVDPERVRDLPLNGRTVYGLVSILPGVSKATTVTTGDNQGNFVSANGSRTRQSNFLLDGGFNNNLVRNGGNAAPNPDPVCEFRLLTRHFNAAFGRLSC